MGSINSVAACMGLWFLPLPGILQKFFLLLFVLFLQMRVMLLLNTFAYSGPVLLRTSCGKEAHAV